MMRTTAQYIEKRPEEKALKKSVSMPRIMFYNAQARARARGLTQFSDYIQDLIRRDEQTVTVQ